MTGRILIAIGIFCIAAGITIERGIRIPLGRLPGDIIVKKGNWTVYVPITTCLIVSMILTVLLFTFRRK
jgi:uncharacterized membrane protein